MNTISRRSSYIPRARAAIANYRQTGRKTTKKPLMRVLVTQSVLCIIVALFFVGVKSLDLPYVQALNNNIKYFLTYSIDYQQSFKNIQQTYFNYFPSQQTTNGGEKVNDNL